MKRVLVVADDPALTRFVAEALLERPLTGPPQPDDAWEVRRAHSANEAFLLITRSGRSCDMLVLDPALEDGQAFTLLSKLEADPETRELPFYLLTERGRDKHSRRIASATFRAAGFIDKPVTADGLREVLSSSERARRVLVVDHDAERGQRLSDELARGGFRSDACRNATEAAELARSGRPDAICVDLQLEESALELCVDLKRAQSVRVILYGPVSLLARGIDDNAHRADDFLPAPFDDELLVDRVARLVGHGGKRGKRFRRGLSGARRLPPGEPTKRAPTDAPEPPVTSEAAKVAVPQRSAPAKRPSDGFKVPTPLSTDLDQHSKTDAGIAAPPRAASQSTPPPSASPSPTSPARRSTRRVPCEIVVAIQKDGDEFYRSKTLDISHGGIFLATSDPVAVGTKLDMTFALPDSDRDLKAVGKIAWNQQGRDGKPDGVGVKFSRIDPKDLQLIVDYVNRLSRVVYSEDGE